MNDRDGNTCDGDIINDLIGGLEHSRVIRSSLDRSTVRSHHGEPTSLSSDFGARVFDPKTFSTRFD